MAVPKTSAEKKPALSPAISRPRKYTAKSDARAKSASGKRTEKQTYSTQGLDTIDGQMFPRAEKVIAEKDGKTSTMEIKIREREI